MLRSLLVLRRLVGDGPIPMSARVGDDLRFRAGPIPSSAILTPARLLAAPPGTTTSQESASYSVLSPTYSSISEGFFPVHA